MRDLVKDIRNLQLESIICFGVLLLVLCGFVFGFYSLRVTEDMLGLLTDSLRQEILEQQRPGPDFSPDGGAPPNLCPWIQRALRAYPPGYAGGFYIPASDGRTLRRIAGWGPGLGQARSAVTSGGLWRWQSKQAWFALEWSGLRRASMLVCAKPVRIGDRLIGFSFSGARWPGILSYLGGFGLLFLGAGAGAVLISGPARRRLRRRIRGNILRLAPDRGPDPQPTTDEYQDFFRVARHNRRIFRKLKTTAQSRAELLANCPWGYAVIDAVGKCRAINEKGTIITGLQRGDYVGGQGTDWQAAAGPREPAFCLGSLLTLEVIFLRRVNGEPRHFLTSSTPTVLEEGATGYIAWFIDITSQKQKEEKIRQLAAMVEFSADAIFGFALNNEITTWNHGAETMYGYSAAEMIGKSHQMLVPPELQEQLQGILQTIREGSGLAEFETERIRKDHVRIYVSVKISVIRDDKGRVTGFSTIHRDITDKRRYEMNLKAERERLSVTLNSIDAGVISTDRFGRIVFINRNAARLTGWPVAEALEQPLLKILYLLDNQTSEAYEGLVAQVLGSENPVQFQNAVLVNRDLQEVPISISCTRIKTAVESFAGIVLVFEDITEKLKTEAELLRAEKLESLGILAGGIAHDFNNFLAAVVANLQLAMIKLEKGMDITKYLTETVAISQRASELTKQLLTFSKGGAPVKKAASLVDLIQDTTRFVLHGSKVKAILEIDPDLLPVEVDEGQISQVIHNLILNAHQAMPEGGIVRVRAENVVLGAGGRCRPGGYVRISIRDSGAGIPKEIIHKIFDPYFTTKKDGNGLGLATTYSIIKKHDGYIEVESAENVGTTFVILLPTAQTAAPLQELEAPVAASFDGAKILLMDDEEVILKVVGEMMKYFGYKVTLARDGAEAIRYYQQAMEAREPYDAVVMDLTIPGGMGGPEAMAYLREIDPGVRAIVSSGYYNDPIMADYESYGFCGVVRKPYRFEELNQVLSEVVDKRQLQLDLEYHNL